MHARTAPCPQVATVTEFGTWLDNYLRSQQPPIGRPELARRTGIDVTTIGRWIRNEIQPTTEKLRLLAPVLGVDHGELLTIAGHGTAPVEPAKSVIATPPMHPLAVELGRMLADNSPMPVDRRERLEMLIDQILEPERKHMRTRRGRTA